MSSRQKQIASERRAENVRHFQLWKEQSKSGVLEPAIAHLVEANSERIDRVPNELKYSESYQRELLETFVDTLAPTWSGAQNTYLVREFLRDERKFSPRTKLMPLYDADGQVLIPEHPVAVEIYREDKRTGQHLTKVMVFDFDAKKSAGGDGMKVALNEACAIFAFFAKIGCSNLFMDRSDSGGYHVIVPLGQWKSHEEIRLTLDAILKAVPWQTLDPTVMTSRKSCLTIPGSPNKSGTGFRILTHSDFVPSNPIIGERDQPIMFRDLLTMGSSNTILSEVRRKMKNIRRLRERSMVGENSRAAAFREDQFNDLRRQFTKFQVPDTLWRNYSSQSGSGLGGMKRQEFIDAALTRAAGTADHSQARMIISSMTYKVSNGIFELFARKLLGEDRDGTDYGWTDRFNGSAEDQERHLRIEFDKARAWAEDSGWVHSGAYLTPSERAEFKVEGFVYKPSAVTNMALPSVKQETERPFNLPTEELRRGFAWDMRLLRMKYNGAFMGKRFNDDKEMLEGFYRAAAFVYDQGISKLNAPFELSATFLARFTGWQVPAVYKKAFDASLPFFRRYENGDYAYHLEVEGERQDFAAPELKNVSMPVGNVDVDMESARSSLLSLSNRTETLFELVSEGLADAAPQLIELVKRTNLNADRILDGHGRKPREQDIYFVDGDGNRMTLRDAKQEIVDSISDEYIRAAVGYLLTENVLNTAEIHESVSRAVRASSINAGLMEGMVQLRSDARRFMNAGREAKDFMVSDKLKKVEDIANNVLSGYRTVITDAIVTAIYEACDENRGEQVEQGAYFIEQKADYDNSGVSRIFRSPLHENRELNLSEALQAASTMMSQTTFYDGFMDDDNAAAVRSIRNKGEGTDRAYDRSGSKDSVSRTTTALRILEQAPDAVIQLLETFYSFKSQRVAAYGQINCAPVEGTRRLPVTTIAQLHTGRQMSDVTSGQKSASKLEYTSAWTYIAPPIWFTDQEDLQTGHVEPLWSQHDKKQGLSTLHRDVHAFLLGERTFMNSLGEQIDFNKAWMKAPLVDRCDFRDFYAGGVTLADVSESIKVSLPVLRQIVNDLERIGLLQSAYESVSTERKPVFRSLKDQAAFNKADVLGRSALDRFWKSFSKSAEPTSVQDFSYRDSREVRRLSEAGDLNPDFPTSQEQFDEVNAIWGVDSGATGRRINDHRFANADVKVYQKRYLAQPLTEVNLPFLFQQTRSWHAYLNSNDLRSVLRFEKYTQGGQDRLADFREKSQRLGVSMKAFDYLVHNFVAVADPFSDEMDSVELHYTDTLQSSHRIIDSHLGRTANLWTYRAMTRSVSNTDKHRRSLEVSEQISATLRLNKVWNESAIGQFDATELFNTVLDSKVRGYVNELEVEQDDTDWEQVEFETFAKYRLYWMDPHVTGIIEYWTRWLMSDAEDRDIDTFIPAQTKCPTWDWGRTGRFLNDIGEYAQVA